MSRRPRTSLRAATPALLALSALLALALPAAAPPGAAATYGAPLQVTNPYMPLVPGRVQAYEGTSDGLPFAVVVRVLHETRRFALGGEVVPCLVQQEAEYTAGVLSEISYNYFAQADDGSVRCFGEVVDAYQDGAVVSHDGSWLVGGPSRHDDPAGTLAAPAPTVFMAAAPAVGDSWKPDDLYPHLDETVTVMGLGMRVHVPAGVFGDAMEVEETSDVDDDKPETKWYAPGTGLVKGRSLDGSLHLVGSTR